VVKSLCFAPERKGKNHDFGFGFQWQHYGRFQIQKTFFDLVKKVDYYLLNVQTLLMLVLYKMN